MIFLPEIEFQSAEAIRALQHAKLKDALAYLAAHSPFYKKRFSEFSVSIDEIKTIEDLAKIPTTTKDDLQQHNLEFLCVDRSLIAEYTSTSGTLGKPVTIALTAHDLQRLAYNEYISFMCAGVKPTDVVQLMLTLDRQFMAGIAYYEGLKKLGAGIVRVGPGLPAMQWETIERLKPTALVVVPSFLIKLIEYAEEQRIDLNHSGVRMAVCIGESLKTQQMEYNALARYIQHKWNIELISTYASTEMQTAFTECTHRCGGHHHPELVIVELLDENNQPAAPGAVGEVTITTLGVEAMPLLRYKTGDLCIAYTAPCACGRNTMRLGPVVGRKQQMIKLKGTTIYPPGIFELINEVKEISDYLVEASTGAHHTDELKIYYLCSGSDSLEAAKKLRNAFQSRLRVVPDMVQVDRQQLELLLSGSTGRKITKFLDKRL